MKKKEKMLRSMDMIDEKYVAEADPRITRTRARRKLRLRVIAACVALVTLSLSLWLFIPFNTELPDVSQYAGSEYYGIIEKLNAITFTPPPYRNNFEKYVSRPFRDAFAVKEDSYLGFDGGSMEVPTTGENDYVEVTDNQVTGVIEGDLIKRTGNRAFYLRGNTLTIYSIEGEESLELGSYRIDPFFDETGYFYYNMGEIYLSQDGNTVTVIVPYSLNGRGSYVGVLSLDVSNPQRIFEKGRIAVTGGYLSSRSVDGTLLLVSEFYVGRNPDFSDEANYLPQIVVAADERFSIPVEQIISPETLTSSRYTVICELDQNTLALDGCSALLSYSQEIYVSQDSIYATRDYAEKVTEGFVTTSRRMTEISRLYYGGEGLVSMGSVTLEGSVKDQYSMDQHEGYLRVVTTTSVSRLKKTVFADGNAVAEFVDGDDVGTNASLYVIDLHSMSVAASVEQFAPQGETVQSVRFDGDLAYVCTSVQLSDPVFFFDLSDLDNITWKDTGEIEGFSSSLVNFGDGFLLGIGRGNSWSSVKVEIWEEGEDGVNSVCVYDVENGTYSGVYKSYLINRAESLVGLGIHFYDERDARYVLLHFDGYDLHEIVSIPVSGDLATLRAFLADGYLYVFGQNDFVVKKLG